MHYEEIKPVESLAGFIKCFWVLEGLSTESAGWERILPDGCTEIVFHLGDRFEQHTPDGASRFQPLALLVGQMRNHLLIQPTGRVRVLGVRFWPGGSHPFLPVPQNEIADQIIPLDAVWGGFTRELHARLAEAATWFEGISRIETALLKRLSRFGNRDDSFQAGIALMLRSDGRVPIEKVAGEMGLSLRQIDRMFNARVGLSPKTLCRILRFQRVFKMLECDQRHRSWAQIAVDCGYYDQAHLIKEFKAFAGQPPTGYFAEPNVISDHFTASL